MHSRPRRLKAIIEVSISGVLLRLFLDKRPSSGLPLCRRPSLPRLPVALRMEDIDDIPYAMSTNSQHLARR